MARLELNKLRSLKNAAAADAVKFEKLFAAALNLVKHDTELLKRREYLEITGEILDEFINYKMKTGQHSDAHYYNEVKKLLFASSKCGSNLFKFAGTADIEAVQQIIPENSLYVNIAKNKDDLFVWSADKKTKKAFVVENGYVSFLKFYKDYKISASAGKDLSSSSRELAKILSPLYIMMKDKKMILISADSDSEKIPFEIAGDGEMISNKSRFIYIPSLLISTAAGSTISRQVYLPETDNSAAAYLGRVAIKESGMSLSSKPEKERGIVHLTSKIRYNSGRREFTFNNKNIKNTVNNSQVVFAQSDGIEGAGITDFLLSGREFNPQAVLLNSSQIQDTNNALFIEEFYRNAGKGVSLQESFASALNRVKNSRFSYPSNWSGYRLNIYNLNLLKEK